MALVVFHFKPISTKTRIVWSRRLKLFGFMNGKGLMIGCSCQRAYFLPKQRSLILSPVDSKEIWVAVTQPPVNWKRNSHLPYFCVSLDIINQKCFSILPGQLRYKFRFTWWWKSEAYSQNGILQGSHATEVIVNNTSVSVDVSYNCNCRSS